MKTRKYKIECHLPRGYSKQEIIETKGTVNSVTGGYYYITDVTDKIHYYPVQFTIITQL